MSFFRFVQKHCVLFGWICWLYIILVFGLAAANRWEERTAMLLLAPGNLISWPVLTEIWRKEWRNIRFLDERILLSLAFVGLFAIAPILALLGMV